MCDRHYELEIESYRTQRNQFLQNSMNPNNVFPSQAPPQAYMMGPGHAGPGPMGGGGGGFMAAGPNPPLPPGPPPSKPLQ